jgi:hypothetical protein
MKASVENELLLSHDELLKIFDYNVETGIFTYKISTANRIHIGDIANTKSHGYIRIKINGRQYAAHRLAWFYVTGNWPINQIDHMDNIRDHNWFSNLREVTNKINAQNKKTSLKNNSICNTIPGVTFDKREQKYRVGLRLNGILMWFGYYATQIEDESVCLIKRRELFEGNLI